MNTPGVLVRPLHGLSRDSVAQKMQVLLQNAGKDVLHFHDTSEKKVADSLLEGSLYKLGEIHRAWKKRFFVLHKNGALEYFNTRDDKQACGSIALGPLTSVQQLSAQGEEALALGRGNVFVITGPEKGARRFILSAKTEGKMDGWVWQLQQVVQAAAKPRLSFGATPSGVERLPVL